MQYFQCKEQHNVAFPFWQLQCRWIKLVLGRCSKVDTKPIVFGNLAFASNILAGSAYWYIIYLCMYDNTKFPFVPLLKMPPGGFTVMCNIHKILIYWFKPICGLPQPPTLKGKQVQRSGRSKIISHRWLNNNIQDSKFMFEITIRDRQWS